MREVREQIIMNEVAGIVNNRKGVAEVELLDSVVEVSQNIDPILHLEISLGTYF